MKVKKIFMALFIIVAISCKKDNKEEEQSTTADPIISFYNTDAAVALPVKVYIDGEMVGSTNAVYMPQHIPDCGKVDVNFKTTAGNHTFALVANDGYFTTGNFKASANGCLKIEYHGSNFTSINYGTKNGTLSIMSGILNANPIDVWIDNNFVGQLRSAAITYRCGENRANVVISLPLAPGAHSYKAVESGTNRTWTGSRTITANACQPLSFGL